MKAAGPALIPASAPTFAKRHGRRRWPGRCKGKACKSLIVSHFHPDHVGLAGWLCERYGLELTMPRPEYLHSLVLQCAPADYGEEVFRPFYQRHGLSAEATEIVLSRGHEYLKRTTGVPASYHRIKHGDTLAVGTADLSGADRRRPCAGAGYAVPARGTPVHRRRSGHRADIAECQRPSDGAGPGCAWHLSELRCAPSRQAWRRMFWCCRAMGCRSTACTNGSRN